MTTTVADSSDIVQQIAAETNTSTEIVRKLYVDCLAEFGEGAVVRDYVPLCQQSGYATRFESLRARSIDA